MPFSEKNLFYGSERGEVLTAAEILYNKGFDEFHFVGSYKSLFQDINRSFIKTDHEAQKRILENLELRRDACWELQLKVEA